MLSRVGGILTMAMVAVSALSAPSHAQDTAETRRLLIQHNNLEGEWKNFPNSGDLKFKISEGDGNSSLMAKETVTDLDGEIYRWDAEVTIDGSTVTIERMNDPKDRRYVFKLQPKTPNGFYLIGGLYKDESRVTGAEVEPVN